MTVSALTRPGERDRLIVKLGEIDWLFCLALCLIAGTGASQTYVTNSRAMLLRINKFVKEKNVKNVKVVIMEIASAAKGGTANA